MHGQQNIKKLSQIFTQFLVIDLSLNPLLLWHYHKIYLEARGGAFG